MANLFNKDQKNNTDSVTEGATGVAKTGTGSKYTDSNDHAAPVIVMQRSTTSRWEAKARLSSSG